MNVDEDTLRRIIRSELGTELDARFDSFGVKIDKKLDARFDAFELKIDRKLDARFDASELKLAKFFGQTQRHFDTRFKKLERKFDKKFDRMQNTLDGLVKRMDHDDVDRMGMNTQLDRHDAWIGELAHHTNTTLSRP